jgi:hypothetical protein
MKFKEPRRDQSRVPGLVATKTGCFLKPFISMQGEIVRGQEKIDRHGGMDKEQTYDPSYKTAI